jgi:hypothetical protein
VRTLAAALLVPVFALGARADLGVVFRNTATIPATATDQNAQPFTITGLSAITRRTGDEYLAVMDNSNKVVRLNVTFAADGSITAASVVGGLSLPVTRDFEGIAFTNPGRNTVLVSEETTPAVLEFSLADGALVRTIAAPAVFSSIRPNFGFESLALSAAILGTGRLWTANEEALSVDGPLSTATTGTEVRLLQWNLASWSPTPGPQFVYLTQPWHGGQLNNLARSGLCDLVALPDGRMLTLERSFAFNFSGPFQARIYELSTAGATDVSALTTLTGQTYTRATKSLRWSGFNVGNLEGLALGPELAGGGSALLGVADNGGVGGANTLAAFALTGTPPVRPPCRSDVNGDGVRTPADIFAFLTAYFAADPATDFNLDGVRAPADIFAFLNAYFAACP